MLEKEEGDDLVVCCTSEIATDIFNTRKYENYCCSFDRKMFD